MTTYRAHGEDLEGHEDLGPHGELHATTKTLATQMGREAVRAYERGVSLDEIEQEMSTIQPIPFWYARCEEMGVDLTDADTLAQWRTGAAAEIALRRAPRVRRTLA